MLLQSEVKVFIKGAKIGKAISYPDKRTQLPVAKVTIHPPFGNQYDFMFDPDDMSKISSMAGRIGDVKGSHEHMENAHFSLDTWILESLEVSK